MPNMPIALALYAVLAMKLRANVVALFFFEFRNECERMGRYGPKAAVEHATRKLLLIHCPLAHGSKRAVGMSSLCLLASYSLGT